MKLILRIARTELATLFYSPIAWLILLVFASQVGVDFMKILTEVAKLKALGREINFSITAAFLLGHQGLFEVIQQTLYLYIPLLTMGLMSREYSSGSIKLLYSSPVTDSQIVFGKFLAMVFFALLLTFILFLPTFVIMYGVPNVDYTLLASGLLGLFLLICTYCSIGLFMSALTAYQVVAAVATLSALAFLSFVGEIGQEHEFIRELTYWLSMDGRASEMVGGLICSEDVIYFLAVIGLFISLTIMKIANEKTHLSIFVKTGYYLLALVIVMTIGYISSRPAIMSFYDATHAKQRTLAENSQEVMKQLEGPLKITTFLNIFDADFQIGAPKNVKDDQKLFKMYTRFKPEIKLEYVYYYNRPAIDSTLAKEYPGMTIDQIAVSIAHKKGFNPKRLKTIEEVSKIVDLAPEDYRFVRMIERGSGERSFLRIFDDMFRHPEEPEISAAFKKLIAEPVKVGFVVGHGERDLKKGGDQDYSIFASRRTFRNSMINQGFDVVPIQLDTLSDVPAKLDILLIADMRTSMTAHENEVMDRYLARGGNLMVMADINRQQVLNPLLAKLGLALQKGILVQPSEIYLPNLILSRATPEGAELLKGVYRSMNRRPYMAIPMPGAVALRVVGDSGFQKTPLLVTQADQTWVEYETTDFINQPTVLNPNAGEQMGSYVTSYALTRNVGEKEQRIIVVGDADCISNVELMLSDRTGFVSKNFNMIPSNFRWLCYGAFPVTPSRARNIDTDVTISPIQLPTIKLIYVWIIPALIGFGGIAVWLRRRRR